MDSCQAHIHSENPIHGPGWSSKLTDELGSEGFHEFRRSHELITLHEFVQK